MSIRKLDLHRTALSWVLVLLCSHGSRAQEILDLGARRELFVDQFLIETMEGDVRLQVQQPTPQEVVLVTGESWEGNTCAYYSIFQDGDLYRMYYRGSHAVNMKSAHAEVTCYAESSDGIHWEKPNLGLFEWEGSKDNNIVWTGIGTHCFVPFLDRNPDCTPDARYKAISRGRPQGSKGLYVFKSPDGIHWSLIKDHPVITEGAFDSQNLAFWDPVSRQYVDYHRTFSDGVRSIMMCTSDDFIQWSKPVLLQYPDAPNQHLYTNAIRPYAAAPHIRIGFPTRFLPKSQQVEPVFMASRDGVVFRRYDEAVIPQSAPKDRDGNRSNYMTNGLLELPGRPDELSVYATEAYYAGPDSRVRRFAYRRDGFVAMQGSGTVLTKPLTFAGRKLDVNYRCGENGSLLVEICNPQGTPISGHSMANCRRLTGDSVSEHVTWNDSASINDIGPQPIRLRFSLNNSQLFSMQFVD